MPRTNDTLSKIALVACDMAYAADKPLFARLGSDLQYYDDTPAYQIAPRFLIPAGYKVDAVFDDNDATGFKATERVNENETPGCFN